MNHSEIIKGILALPDRKLVNAINDEATRETIQAIKERAKNGGNVIFDICIKDTQPLEAFHDDNALVVLVYAPLPILAEREEERTRKSQRGRKLQQRAKNNILSGFNHFYMSASDDAEVFIDIVNRKEIEDLFYVPEKQSLYPGLNKTVKKSLREFKLYHKICTKVVPKVKHDLLINTGRDSVQEGVAMVKSYLYPVGYN